MFDAGRFEGVDDDDLMRSFVHIGNLERAMHVQRLDLLGELDARHAWQVDGAADTAGWVAAHDACHPATARLMVERARGVRRLPELAAVAAEGCVTADQLDEIVRVADAETDGEWAEAARRLAAPQLRRLAVLCRRVPDDEAVTQLQCRSLRWRTDPTSGMVRLTGRLTAVDAQIVTGAVAELADGYGPDPDGTWEPFEARCADALVELAHTATGERGVATVVVHATIDAFDPAGTDVPVLADGTPIPVDVARRLACDAARQIVIETADGVIRLGRTARVANHHQRRRITHRDPTCRFPGCDRTRALAVHHLHHWTDGGLTDEDRLAHLCPYHHRYLHDHHWTATGDPTHPDGLTFHRPDGRPYQPHPAPLQRPPPELHDTA